VQNSTELLESLREFIIERLRAWYLERPGLAAEMFEAVRSKRPASLLDFDLRLKAVAAFSRLDEATALATANKRIGNILRQAALQSSPRLKTALLVDDAEKQLHNALGAASAKCRPLIERRQYTEALTALSGLRNPVDRFFDEVMVMTDDQELKKNRLALLSELRDLFLEIADISQLSMA